MGYVLGVDLGTTFSAAAIVRDGVAQVATLGTRAADLPSVVFLREDGELLIGEAAERRSVTEPGRVAREFKRRLGDPTPVLLGGAPFSAHALTARLLRWIVDTVAAREGGPPDRIVVTRPASWGRYKQELLDQALHQAEVDAVTVTEPEAAAVHYASTGRISAGGVVAVYDLGGGTFDATVLRHAGPRFEVVGTPLGIEQLGGVDFDDAVFSFVTGVLGDAVHRLEPDDPATLAALARLRRDCVEAKEALSADTEAAIAVALPTVQREVRLTRAQLEDMVRPALAETVQMLRRALRSADVGPAELDAVLLVGGSSRIPLVSELLTDELQVPVGVDLHPKHAVALGAARLAEHGVPALPGPAVGTVAGAPPGFVTDPGGPTGPVAPGEPGGFDGPTGTIGTTGPTGPTGTTRTTGPVAGLATDPYGGPPAAGAPDPGVPPPGAGGRRTPLVVAGVALATLVVAAAVAGALVLRSRSQSVAADDVPDEPTTTAPPVVFDAVVRPLGDPVPPSTIVFTHEEAGKWNLWYVDADGAGTRPLTTEIAVRAQLPALSPDRRTIAYTVRDEQVWDLYIMDTANQQKLRVARDLAADARATWAPDSRALAFISEAGGQKDLVVLDLRTNQIRRLTDDAAEEGDPAWSPDGTRIAYWRGPDLWTVPAEGGPPTQLTSAPGSEADPAWSPDGSRIAYSSQPPGASWDIVVANADGSDPRPLGPGAATADGDEQDPAWSPDGTRLAFETKRDAQRANPRTDDAEIYVVAADGSDPVRLTRLGGYDGHPAWSTGTAGGIASALTPPTGGRPMSEGAGR